MNMLYLGLLLALSQGIVASILDKRACQANNCIRAVTGTQSGLPPIATRRADCSSFLLATVTPATSTTTVVVTTSTTVTATSTESVLARREPLNPRQVTTSPSSVPTYASACSNSAEYSSACSCWGITQSTTTVPTPVSTTSTTTTVTVTSTVSVCPSGATQCESGCYDLMTSNDNCGTCGNACAAGSGCISGVCVIAPGSTCSNTGTCPFDLSVTGCGTSGTCFCFTAASGMVGGYCVDGNTLCSPTSCTTDADCDGGVCIETCCPGSGRQCASATLCANTSSPSRLFKKSSMGTAGLKITGNFI